MKNKKISFGENRVLLSDILPYEMPIIFSNRHFFEFIKDFSIEIKDDNLIWKSDKNNIVDIIVSLLFDYNKTPKQKADKKFIELDKNNNNKIPFQYDICHKEDSFRRLTVTHPFNQIQMIEFYEKYKELIIYFCSKSNLSIRHPDRIAKYIYYKDKLHKSNLSDEELGVEQYNEEYESLKSYFSYEKYRNIYKFYDDYLFNRCERKYNYLVTLDVSKCFDSIYTHSITWATHGKTFIKDNLNNLKGCFSDKFDTLMQNINYRETNGIIIGPEYSRIFAEIIMQSIDVNLIDILLEKNIIQKQDFEIYRYVDDYFLFYNKEEDKNKIILELRQLLSGYKLYLNEGKAVFYNKPIITNISMAKSKITTLLENSLKHEIYEEKDEKDPEKTIKCGKININSQTLISEFKSIIKESEIEYRNILNYTLAIIEKKLIKIFKEFSVACKDKRSEKRMFKSMQNLLEFITFIYSVSPRVNTTVRFSRILKCVISFLRRKGANKNYKTAIFEQIRNDIFLILKKTRLDKYTQVETSYLLIILQELGKGFYLSEEELIKFFGIESNEKKYTMLYPLNYLSLMLILFYTHGKKQYKQLILFIEKEIETRLTEKKFTLKKCENVMLFFDTLTCPYISKSSKCKILKSRGIKKNNINDMINFRKHWFITWGVEDFNLKKELDAKKGQEVY
jgi:hypothetical protein